MSVEHGTRDSNVAEQIGKAQEFVGQLQMQLRAFVADAHKNEAVGHEGLYEAVEVSLDAAWKSLGEAYEVMEDGDPHDYA